MKILFSPIGKTDPVFDMNDGSMIHICRHYLIDKVYLYMSKEICESQEKDQRYTYCLKKLAENQNRQIDWILIEKRELTDVHLFDYFYNEFREKLTEIRNNFPDAEFYVNISSGTPAMKNALSVLPDFLNLKIIPLQVTTPQKKSNIRKGLEEKASIEIQWENNIDNEPDAENRCLVSNNTNFALLLKMEMLKNLIDKYDYYGAYQLIDNIHLPETATKYIHGAYERYSFKTKDSQNHFGDTRREIFPCLGKDNENIVEYFLILNVKIQKDELSDFLKGITPLLNDIFLKILEKRNVDGFSPKEQDKYKISINNKKNVWCVDRFTSGENGEQKKYRISEDKKNIEIWQLVQIIKDNLPDDTDLQEKCDYMRKISEALRNVAAHQLRILDKDVVKSLLRDAYDPLPDNEIDKFTAYTVIEKLYQLLPFCGINIKKGSLLSSYDKMNEIIIGEINNSNKFNKEVI